MQELSPMWSQNQLPQVSDIRALLSNKAEDSNTIGAIRIATSSDIVAPKDFTTAQALQGEAPTASTRLH